MSVVLKHMRTPGSHRKRRHSKRLVIKVSVSNFPLGWVLIGFFKAALLLIARLWARYFNLEIHSGSVIADSCTIRLSFWHTQSWLCLLDRHKGDRANAMPEGSSKSYRLTNKLTISGRDTVVCRCNAHLICNCLS